MECPLEDGAQVRLVAFQTIEPSPLLRTVQEPFGGFGEFQEIAGMSPAYCLSFATLIQALGGELPNSLEHLEACFDRVFGLSNQAVVSLIAPRLAPALARRDPLFDSRPQRHLSVRTDNQARDTYSHMLVRHVLPNCPAMLMVQATFIFADVVLGEGTLSFLGAGTPPDIPS